MNVPGEVMDAALSKVSVKGRTQIIPEALSKACVVIDYAHNAFSSECVLEMLRAYEPKRLICIFGCGGNRAAARRIGMGEVAGRMADLSIITMDNPRFESMEDINKGIIEGKFDKVIQADTGLHPEQAYVLLGTLGERTCKLVFEPNEELLKAIKRYNPRGTIIK
jgi:UDP-N-acetylmuramyl tripeptide synthase